MYARSASPGQRRRYYVQIGVRPFRWRWMLEAGAISTVAEIAAAEKINAAFSVSPTIGPV